MEFPGKVDHLLFAVPDLEAGMEAIGQVLGVTPQLGGRHPDFGTRNALIALGPETYLEVIAPDHELARPERGRVLGLDTRKEPALATWVLREEDVEKVADRARSAGVGLGSVFSGSRVKPDGTRVSWSLTDPYSMPLDGAVPFLIAWGDTPHPAASAPKGCALVDLRVEHPQPDTVRRALRVLGVEMTVSEGPRMRLVAGIRTARGIVEIS